MRSLLASLAVSLFALPGLAQRVAVSPAPEVRLPGGDLRRLALPSAPVEAFEVSLRVDGRRERLLLERHSVRAADAVLRVYEEGPEGARLVERPLPEVRTYRGKVAGDPGRVVLASLTERGLAASILRADGSGWDVEPLGDGAHRVRVRTHDHWPAACGVDDGLQGAPPPPFGGRLAVPIPGGIPQTLHLADIAFEADYEYYQLFGSSVPQTIARIDQIMNEVDYFYARDVLITYELTGYVVRTAPFYTPTTGGDLLDQFRAEWNNNQGAIQRDIAHLMTAKPGGVIQYGGLAWVGVVCTSSAYGWSLDSAGIVGHEVGHNWNAPHCLDPSPCNNMCGACLYIGPVTKGVIEAHRDSRACLRVVGPYETQVPPYAYPDSSARPKRDFGSLGPVRLDPLRNDHDANGDELVLVSFDATTANGGSVARSVGTGPGGRDELLYTFPAVPFVGEDSIAYTVGDGLGNQTLGEVVVDLRTQAPQGYWPFDEGTGRTVADVSGNGYDAETWDAVNWIASPVAGSAMGFNGTTQGLTTNPEEFGPPWTLSAWVERRFPQGSSSTLAESTDGSVRTEQVGTNLELGITKYGIVDASFGVKLPLKVWTHLVLVGTPTETSVYLDGVYRASVPVSIRAPMKPASASGSPLRAALDELRVYPYAFTAAEVQELYQHGGGAVGPLPGDGRFLGLPDTPLTWVAGLEADSHDLYLGEDWQAVRDATPLSPEFVGNLAGTTWSPMGLLDDQTYFWRVDTHVGPMVLPGPLWQFALADRWRWALDEDAGTTAVEEDGTANGTYYGSPLLGQPGATPNTGTSVYLDGSSDFVVLPPLDLDTNRLSITGWVRRDGAQAWYAGLVFTRDGNTVAGINILQATNKIGYHWNNSSAAYNWDSGLLLPDDLWVFVALVVEPSQATMYLGDGGVLTSAVNAISHPVEEFDGELDIGRDRTGARRFQGWVDDVRIHRTALTPDEVESLYLGSL